MKRKTKVAEVSFVVEFFSRSFISVYEAKRIFRMDGNYYYDSGEVKQETINVPWWNIFFPDYQLASNHKREKI